MLISGLGEFGLIERFRKLIRNDRSVIVGSGDDCAVLAYTKRHYQLFTCDMIVEGVDFTRYDPAQLIGRKAVAISISDIAACGGIPRHCVVSLGLPKILSVRYVEQLFRGMLAIAKRYKINIVGGDLSSASKITIDVSMLGLVEKKRLVLRSGAKVGDLIFTTGPLGGSIKGKHLRFIPRVKEARELVMNYNVHAMIDISDGLVQDLLNILESSKVGAILYDGLIPLSRQARTLNDAFYSGEDFELIFTLPPKDAKKIIKKRRSGFRLIGEVVDKKFGLQLVDEKGKGRPIASGGFRHF